MSRMTVVYHMALAKSDGKVVVSRIGEARRDGAIVSGTTHCVTLTPVEARQMAKAMRDTYALFFKKDGDQSVEVWCEEHEAFLWLEEQEVFQMIWTREDGAEVREEIRCSESGGDGWSWEFAQALEDAAGEAEAGE